MKLKTAPLSADSRPVQCRRPVHAALQPVSAALLSESGHENTCDHLPPLQESKAPLARSRPSHDRLCLLRVPVSPHLALPSTQVSDLCRLNHLGELRLLVQTALHILIKCSQWDESCTT